MHDTILLSDNEVEIAKFRGQVASITVHQSIRTPSRTNFWTIVGFCLVGLICSLFVPASYLHIEQTPILIAEAPLS